MSTTDTALLWNTDAILLTPDEREIRTPMRVYKKGEEFLVLVGDPYEKSPESRLPSDFRAGAVSIAQSVAAWLRPLQASQNAEPEGRRRKRKGVCRASCGPEQFPLRMPLRYIECRGREEDEGEKEANDLAFSVLKFFWAREKAGLAAEPEFENREIVSREEVERMIGQRLEKQEAGSR